MLIPCKNALNDAKKLLLILAKKSLSIVKPIVGAKNIPLLLIATDRVNKNVETTLS